MLFHASDLKRFGEKKMFLRLVDELNLLKTVGIEIRLPNNENITVYLCIASFLGDNLGLNTLLGFQESFSANSFCRFCKTVRSQTQTLCFQVTSSLRNLQNYNEDLAIDNASLTGIKFSPIFNCIDLFHVTSNFCVDIAHDIFEGVGILVMANLLYQFIIIDKFFDLEVLNNRIRFFDFGPNQNRPPVITLDNFKKKSLKMSASEMKAFIINSGLLFGYFIPEGNRHWRLYILLRKIVRIILSVFVTPDMYTELAGLIYQHHSLVLELFRLLTPKCHIMTHYPLIMEKIGPLINVMTLRYESKHRQSKLAANITASRVNITRTLAMYHQIQLASRIALNHGFQSKVHISFVKSKQSKMCSALEILLESDLYASDSRLSSYNENIREAYKVTFDNKTFREKEIILIKKDNPCLLGSIQTILINKHEEVCFIYKELKLLDFNEHLFAYEVSYTNNLRCVFHLDIPSLNVFALIKLNNHMFVAVA